METERIAFVAMKYGDLSTQTYLSRARTYDVISECLEEAGFSPVRGDKILSSGPSVDEVCNLIRTASLIVVDTTGDSHSVSYELGYCHGVGRLPRDILLIRQDDGSAIPFNYRHYRHRAYKDLKHLRQLIREWFNISSPLLDQELGFAFNFVLLPNHSGTQYGADVAKVIIKAIKQVNFSGRCEYYAADGFAYSMLDSYLIGLGLKPKKKAFKLTYSWWEKFIEVISNILRETDTGIKLNNVSSDIHEMREIKFQLLPRGTVEFSNGNPVMVINEAKADAWFTSEILGIIKGETEVFDSF